MALALRIFLSAVLMERNAGNMAFLQQFKEKWKLKGKNKIPILYLLILLLPKMELRQLPKQISTAELGRKMGEEHSQYSANCP